MAKIRIALGLVVLLTVNAAYTHTAAAVARRELLQAAPKGATPITPSSGPADATFTVMPPTAVEDVAFFDRAISTTFPNGPEASIPAAGPAPPVALNLPPEAALGPQSFTDPGNAAAYDAIQEASIDTLAIAQAMGSINGQGLDPSYQAALDVVSDTAGLAAMIRVISISPYDNQQFASDIQNVAAQFETVLRSAVSPPTQVASWVALPANADPTTLNEIQLWQYYYNALVVPAQTALADYLANPGDRRYLEAFTTAAALTSGANTGGQHWSVALAPAQLLNYMAVVTNPAGSCAVAPLINQVTAGAHMCLFQNQAGLGAQLEYNRHNYVFIAQYLLSTSLLTATVAAACEAVVNAVVNGGDQTTYDVSIASYKGWYKDTVDNIYAYYEDMATYFWNNQFQKDVASAINVGIDGSITSAAMTQNLLGFLNQKYDFSVWNGFVFTAPGLYTQADGQVWAQVGGCMAGRVGVETLWVPINPTTCSTKGGSIYYPNYPLANGTNIGYVLFYNAAGEVTPLPGDNSKITSTAQGCQGSTSGDPQSLVNCVSAAYPNRGIIALKPGNNVPDPSAYAAGSYAPYIFFSNLAASGIDSTGTNLALLPPP